MHNLKMIKLDSVIYEFSYNNEFQKYIKAKDLLRIIEDFIAYCKLAHIRVPPELINSDYTFDINLDPDQKDVTEVLKLIILGKDREKIELPSPLNSSYEFKKPLFYSHRNLDHFVDYWNKSNPDLLKYQLFETLSEDIIEVPYVDKPSDYEMRYNHAAFHLNHGTTHAIRLVTYFNQFEALFKDLNLHLKVEDRIIPLLTNEEKHCLQLAMFLFRSGRTNEIGWKDDFLYSPRSACIFSSIALKLGYDPILVRTIAQCFDYKQAITCEEGFYSLSLDICTQKAAVYQTLFALSHISDLIRCNSSYVTLTEDMRNVLGPYLASNPDIHVNELIHNYFVFAAECCKKTGAGVMVSELSPQKTTIHFDNPYVAVNAVSNVQETFVNLHTLASEFQFNIRNTLDSLLFSSEELDSLVEATNFFSM